MARLTGRVTYPGDPGWDEARKVYNRRFDVQPKAVVFCQDTQDVVNAFTYARENDLPFRVRSGRHNYEGYSLVPNGIVIDLSDIDQVRVDREGLTATLGAGNYMLRCSEWLGQLGVTIPLATGPTVGIGGLTLGGGFGLTSRRLGLTCDSLLSATVVNAEGQVITASETENCDLFWALRGGGGGNFGIVTDFSFKVHPVSYVAAVMVEWSWDHFEEVVDKWLDWSYKVDDAFCAVLQLTVEKKIKLYGLYTPEDPTQLAGLDKLLNQFLQPLPLPIGMQIQSPLPFLIGSRLFFAEGNETVDPIDPEWGVHVHSNQQIYKSTSAAVVKPMNKKGIATLKEHLEAVPPLTVPAIQPSMVQLLPGGGAPSRIATDATAVYLRQARCIIQYDGFWKAPQDEAATIGWVKSFREAMQPYTVGAYVNYSDSDLPDYLHEYYGPNLQRLVQVKQAYDPNNVFNFPQSIPTSLSGAGTSTSSA